MGQVIRGAPVTQAADGRGESRRRGGVAVGGGQPGQDQVPFGPQY